MTAAVLGGVGRRLFIDEIDLAPPRDGEVLVKVAASGLCASDLNAIDGKRTLAPFPLVPAMRRPGSSCRPGRESRGCRWATPSSAVTARP
jgi:threonine dehydrogenase-like Zn-dependent dehydrogenase